MFNSRAKNVSNSVYVVTNSWNQFGKVQQVIPFGDAQDFFGAGNTDCVAVGSAVTLNTNSSDGQQGCNVFLPEKIVKVCLQFS